MPLATRTAAPPSVVHWCRILSAPYKVKSCAELVGSSDGRAAYHCSGLEEDDPRNPACVTDNVGGNADDIAGMGADLFGSFARSTVAALVIAANANPKGEFEPLGNNLSGLYLPVLISSSGAIVGMFTMFLVLASFRGWGKSMQGSERRLSTCSSSPASCRRLSGRRTLTSCTI